MLIAAWVGLGRCAEAVEAAIAGRFSQSTPRQLSPPRIDARVSDTRLRELLSKLSGCDRFEIERGDFDRSGFNCGDANRADFNRGNPGRNGIERR